MNTGDEKTEKNGAWEGDKRETWRRRDSRTE